MQNKKPEWIKEEPIILITTILFVMGFFLISNDAITSYAVQDRFLVANITVSAEQFDQEIKVEQFNDYEIKIDNALYYFTAEAKKEQPVSYILVEFEIDNAQLKEFSKEDVLLYYYKDGWIKLETEFVREKGRYNYYKAKADRFGLFAAALRKEEKKEVYLSRSDLILFGIMPIIIIILLLSFISYESMFLIKKWKYKYYILLKNIFLFLTTYILIFISVILILDLISCEYIKFTKPPYTILTDADISYFAVIPILLFSMLLCDIIFDWLVDGGCYFKRNKRDVKKV